jgi:hypothetical protein
VLLRVLGHGGGWRRSIRSLVPLDGRGNDSCGVSSCSIVMLTTSSLVCSHGETTSSKQCPISRPWPSPVKTAKDLIRLQTRPSDTRQKPRGIEHTLRETLRRTQVRPRSLHILSTTQRLASKHRHPEFAVDFSSVRTSLLGNRLPRFFPHKGHRELSSARSDRRHAPRRLVQYIRRQFRTPPQCDEDLGTSSETTLVSLCRVGYISV